MNRILHWANGSVTMGGEQGRIFRCTPAINSLLQVIQEGFWHVYFFVAVQKQALSRARFPGVQRKCPQGEISGESSSVPASDKTSSQHRVLSRLNSMSAVMRSCFW